MPSLHQLLPRLGTRERGMVPVDEPTVHASGPAPYRVLALGGEALAGIGVATHDLSLGGFLARGIADLTGYGVDLQGILLDRATVTKAAQALARLDLGQYDLVMVLLEAESRREAVENEVCLPRLADALQRGMAVGAALAVVDAPPSSSTVSEHDADRMMLALRVGLQAGAQVLSLRSNEVPMSPPVDRYRAWGRKVAVRVASHLGDPRALSQPVEQIDEARRRAAVRSIGPVHGAREVALRRLVSFASAAYGTRCAAMSLMDDLQTQYLVRRGPVSIAEPRVETMCNVALSMPAGLIVSDAREDARFSTLPGVLAGDAAFYAGYRIEDAAGQPVGVLCVFDPEPRPVLTQDLTILRDFALDAGRRLRARTDIRAPRSPLPPHLSLADFLGMR